nr:hypothetical protein [Rhodococcus sp. (in: high G+C Gram-positive bacteria)]
MNKSVYVTARSISVGDIVQVRRPSGDVAGGTLVEDFADYVLAGSALGRDWAVPRRWAIALDEGTLVFVDDSDIIEHNQKP